MCIVKVLSKHAWILINQKDGDVMDKDVRHMLFCTEECRGALRGVELDTILALRYCDTQVQTRANF